VVLAAPLAESPRDTAPGDAPGPDRVEPAAAPVAANGSRRIRVLLADDHKILREGLAVLLREERDLEVVGQAPDGQAAVELAAELRPDVVIMDVTMPRMNGIEATRRLAAEMPGVRVVGLSMHEARDMQAMRDAGAVGYVTKGSPAETLVSAIREAAAAAR
jgi:DNA-binding NarL/FixJ family response regulator